MHGTRNSNNTRVGSIISFACNRGYRLVGLTAISCNRDGNWTGRIPTCQGNVLVIVIHRCPELSS